MTEAIRMTRRQRRGIGAVTMLMGALVAIGSLFFSVTAASAHHPEFEGSRLCDQSWSAVANYIGGSEERLIIMSATVNGQPVSGNGFSPYNAATHGVTNPPVSGVQAWRGASGGFTIFSLSGGNYNPNWSGFIQVYRPIGDVWFPSHSVAITPPGGPGDCATSTPTNTIPADTPTPTNTIPADTPTPTNTVPVETPTPTNTVPVETPTPTSTVPANTPTPTNTVPGNTATPTRTTPANTPTPTNTVPPTTPPCTPPDGGTPPPGGSICTPTPTNTVPPTSTPTTPPCTPPGAGTPPAGGSICTPTPTVPPASTNTPVPPTSTPPMTGCYNGTGNPPAGTVLCTPTPVDTVAGVRTGGPGVPSAGAGLSDMSSTNVVFVLLGLLAVTGGAAFMAVGRTADED